VRIGLLSDSHGRIASTRSGIDALLDRGAELLLHLGDLGTEAVLDELVGRPARVVFGNVDDARSLRRYAELVDVPVDHPLGWIEAGDRRLAYTHGDDERLVRNALGEAPAWLVHGHTHRVRDERIGPTRVVNPGALHRAARYTVALLDFATDDLEIIEIPKGPSVA